MIDEEKSFLELLLDYVKKKKEAMKEKLEGAIE